jgi:hypothetical protein
MGAVLFVSEKPSSRISVLTNRYTGEKTVVEVDPDKYSLYEDDQCIFRRFPDACPFLRFYEQTGKAYCTVHQTRPDMCRDFACWRLIILKSDGSRAGRVMNRRYFYPDDPDLARIWKERIRDINESDDVLWDRTVRVILSGEGYSVQK